MSTIFLWFAIILCAFFLGRFIKIAAGLAIAAGIFYLAYKLVTFLFPTISWTAIFWIAVIFIAYSLVKEA